MYSKKLGESWKTINVETKEKKKNINLNGRTFETNVSKDDLHAETSYLLIPICNGESFIQILLTEALQFKDETMKEALNLCCSLNRPILNFEYRRSKFGEMERIESAITKREQPEMDYAV